MPKRILFEGKMHEFPDDFSDNDIQSALGSEHPRMPAPSPQGLANLALAKSGIQVGPQPRPNLNMQQDSSPRLTSLGSGVGEVAKNTAATIPATLSAVFDPGGIQEGSMSMGTLPAVAAKDNPLGAIGIDKARLQQASKEGDVGDVLTQTGNAVGPLLLMSKVLGGKGRQNIAGANDNLVAAMNPTGKAAGRVVRALGNSADTLTEIANDAAPKDLPAVASALKSKALDLQTKYGLMMQQKAATPVQTSAVADSIRGVKTSVLEQRFPEIAKDIDNLAAKYDGKTMSVQQLDELRTKLNDTLETQLKKDGLAKAQAKRDPRYSYQFAELEAVKDALYNNLGPGARELKMQQSNIQTLQQALENRVGKLSVEQAKSDSIPATVKAGNTAADLLSLHPGNGMRTLLGYMRNKAATPNAQVAAAMEKLAPSHKPAPISSLLLNGVANSQK
jgi:hypothetical protein